MVQLHVWHGAVWGSVRVVSFGRGLIVTKDCNLKTKPSASHRTHSHTLANLTHSHTPGTFSASPTRAASFKHSPLALTHE